VLLASARKLSFLGFAELMLALQSKSFKHVLLLIGLLNVRPRQLLNFCCPVRKGFSHHQDDITSVPRKGTQQSTHTMSCTEGYASI
jgi:hypothetical protein